MRGILKTLDSLVLSFIILMLVYINVYNRSEKVFLHYKLFIALLRTNMGLIVIDLMGWAFDGKPGAMNLILNSGFNLLLYVIEPLGAILWALYANFQVFHDEARIRKMKLPMAALFTANALAAVLSLHTGWFFRIQHGNVYQRGEYYWVHIAFCIAFLVYAFLLIIINGAKIGKRQFYALLLYALPQVLGSAIQIFFYGISLCWTGMMLSLLIVYFNIQELGLNTDYLTGVYNRRQLDSYIREKIRNSTRESSFSVILVDLNDFKQINDMFGHDVGDEALRNAVTVIRSCLRNDDFIARYGGDEFYIILDIDDYEMLAATAARIGRAVERFNADHQKPYQLSLCMGYDVYRRDAARDSDVFLKQIDMLMYRNKELRKKNQPGHPLAAD